MLMKIVFAVTNTRSIEHVVYCTSERKWCTVFIW